MKVSIVVLLALALVATSDARRRLKACRASLAASKAECDDRVADAEDACKASKEELQGALQKACDARVADTQKQCNELTAELRERVQNLRTRLLESGALYNLKHCGRLNKVNFKDNKFFINTEGGNWARDGWCTVLSKRKGEDDTSYTISADLYTDNTDECHLGLAYNVKDIDNYDYVYYRPHSDVRCFQAGHVSNGRTTFALKGACPMQLELQEWFNAKVVVNPSSSKAEFYLNGKLVANSQSMTFPKEARGGIIMANGYDNQAQFRNLEIE